MIKLNFLKKAIFALIMVGSVLFYGCTTTTTEPVPTQTIAQLLAADTTLSIFTSYVTANSTLKGYIEGTAAHTVFAPNNAAFRTLKATLSADLSSIREDVVLTVLNFHFAREQKLFNDILGKTVTTLQTENLTISATGTVKEGGSNTTVKITDAKKDIKATNGVVHVVETILVPPTIYRKLEASLGTTAQAVLLAKDYTYLADIFKVAEPNALATDTSTITGKISSRSSMKSYTCFFPVNSLFDNLGNFTNNLVTKDILLSGWKSSPDIASAVLKKHIFPGLYTFSGDRAVLAGTRITSLAGIQYIILQLPDAVISGNPILSVLKSSTGWKGWMLSTTTNVSEISVLVNSYPILATDVIIGGGGVLHVSIIP